MSISFKSISNLHETPPSSWRVRDLIPSYDSVMDCVGSLSYLMKNISVANKCAVQTLPLSTKGIKHLENVQKGFKPLKNVFVFPALYSKITAAQKETSKLQEALASPAPSSTKKSKVYLLFLRVISNSIKAVQNSFKIFFLSHDYKLIQWISPQTAGRIAGGLNYLSFINNGITATHHVMTLRSLEESSKNSSYENESIRNKGNLYKVKLASQLVKGTSNAALIIAMRVGGVVFPSVALIFSCTTLFLSYISRHLKSLSVSPCSEFDLSRFKKSIAFH